MKPNADTSGATRLAAGQAAGLTDRPAGGRPQESADLPAGARVEEAVHLTLDERIAMAEQRLMARDERLHSGLQALRRRTRHALQPKRLVWPALGLAAVLLASLWLLRRTRTTDGTDRDVSTSARTDAYSPLAADGPWMRGGLLLWPLLPEHWRARVNPALASAMVAIGLPLLQWLLKRRPRVRRSA